MRSPLIASPAVAAFAAGILVRAEGVSGRQFPDAGLHRWHIRRSETVRPDGSSCPEAIGAPMVPPVVNQPATTSGKPAVIPPGNHDANATSPCPSSAGVARTDVARGPSLAKPEPLNAPQLMVPKTRS